MAHERAAAIGVGAAGATLEVVKRRTRHRSKGKTEGGAAHANPNATLKRTACVAREMVASPPLMCPNAHSGLTGAGNERELA
jgi:hypothetical protein